MNKSRINKWSSHPLQYDQRGYQTRATGGHPKQSYTSAIIVAIVGVGVAVLLIILFVLPSL